MILRQLAVSLIVIAMAATACNSKADQQSTSVAGDQGLPAPKDVAAPPADALKTSSGLASKVLIVGLGSIHPTPKQMVTVHYTGWTADGRMFDSSYKNGAPVTFSVGQVIPGWIEALQLMVVGEKRRFWIPGNLAYDSSQDPSDPKGQLCFEIELLDIR